MQRGSRRRRPRRRRTTRSGRRSISIEPGYPKLHFIETSLCRRPDQLVGAEPGLRRGHAAQCWLRDHRQHPEDEVYICRRVEAPLRRRRGLSGARECIGMIEAAMIWNEPNNKSHWDPEIDPDWKLFAEMAIAAAQAIAGREFDSAPRARRHLADRSRVHPRISPDRACSITSTSSRCTVSRSTGTCGRSTSGPPSSTRSAPSPTCRSG